jgi:hypothetical protein
MTGDAGRPVTVRSTTAYFANRSSLARALVPLPEHHCIYVKNPKAGCSTITLWLDRIHTGEHDFDPEKIHSQHRLPRWHEIGGERLAAMMAGAAFRFTFVRDPLSRMESCWINTVLRSRRYRPQLQTAIGLPADPESALTFDQFLDAVEQLEPLTPTGTGVRST